MLMPWGKHEGTPVEDLPEGYLWWLYHHVLPDSQDEELCQAVGDAWQARLAAIRQRYEQLQHQLFRRKNP